MAHALTTTVWTHRFTLCFSRPTSARDAGETRAVRTLTHIKAHIYGHFFASAHDSTLTDTHNGPLLRQRLGRTSYVFFATNTSKAPRQGEGARQPSPLRAILSTYDAIPDDRTSRRTRRPRFCGGQDPPIIAAKKSRCYQMQTRHSGPKQHARHGHEAKCTNDRHEGETVTQGEA